jgi:uncharacterized protein YbjQ (UPF0145 family)
MRFAPHVIPVFTSNDAPPGYGIARVIGPAWGVTVRSRSITARAFAALHRIFGGELAALTELASESRSVAVQRLEQHAQAQGANAVLGMRFDSGESLPNSNEVVAYGTAVVISPVNG